MPSPLPRSSFLLRSALAAVLLGALASPGRAQDSTATDPTVLAAQQLDRGEQWFRARCLECHESGTLANADFQVKWNGRSAFDLFALIRNTMPENEPGTLTSGTYTAIVAYLMRLNGMSVGTSALPSDSAALTTVRLTFVSSTTPKH